MVPTATPFPGLFALVTLLRLQFWHAVLWESQVEHAEAVAHDNEALRAELDRVRAELEASLARSQREAAAAQRQLAELRGQAAALAAEREVRYHL